MRIRTANETIDNSIETPGKFTHLAAYLPKNNLVRTLVVTTAGLLSLGGNCGGSPSGPTAPDNPQTRFGITLKAEDYAKIVGTRMTGLITDPENRSQWIPDDGFVTFENAIAGNYCLSDSSHIVSRRGNCHAYQSGGTVLFEAIENTPEALTTWELDDAQTVADSRHDRRFAVDRSAFTQADVNRMQKMFNEAVACGAVGQAITYTAELADLPGNNQIPDGFTDIVFLDLGGGYSEGLMGLPKRFTDREAKLEALRALGFARSGYGGLFDDTTSLDCPRSAMYGGDALGHGASPL